MKILHDSNTRRLTNARNITPVLDPGTYDINVDPRTGEYYLHERAPFKMPKKIYGGHDDFSFRVLKTFKHVGKGMAVLLSGPKGTGKTLTAKKIAMESNMPVLTVTVALTGMGFTAFLADIPNPAVIFIDEFEKIYHDTNDRNSFLALLDGASDNRHLFILTSNNQSIGEYFTNRPGRVRYHRRYTDLPEATLNEMIEDNMEEGHLQEGMKSLVKQLGSVNPDMLMSLISESQIHNEIPQDFLSFFNIELEFSGPYDVTIYTQGYRPLPKLATKEEQELALSFCSAIHEYSMEYAMLYYEDESKLCEPFDEVWRSRHCYPFRSNSDNVVKLEELNATVTYCEREGSKRTRNLGFTPAQIKNINREGGKIIVETKDGTIYHFTKAAPISYSKVL